MAPCNVFKGLDPITSFFKGGEKLMIFMKVNKILEIRNLMINNEILNQNQNK